MGLQLLVLIWYGGDCLCCCVTGAAAAVVPDHSKNTEIMEFLIRASFATDFSSIGPCLLFRAGGVAAIQLYRQAQCFFVVSGWAGAGWKFQLNPAQMVPQVNLIPHKEKTAAVWISSCQAKQLQVNYALFFLIISWVCNSYLSTLCRLMSLCHHWVWGPPFLLLLS